MLAPFALRAAVGLAGALLAFPAGAAAAPPDQWAVVDPVGLLVHGSAGATSVKLGPPGQYLVRFPASVAKCAYNATVGNPDTPGPYMQPAYAEVGKDPAGTRNAVWVGTYDGNGVPLDQPFHLEVNCSGNLWAVIAASGAMVRASPLFVSSAPVAPPATYIVGFAPPMGACVYTATVGATKKAPPPLPIGGATVSYAGGGNVRVQTFNAAGVLTPLPFHLSATCALATTITAVADAAGTFVRGLAGTTVTHWGPGMYVVRFPLDVSTCAWVATLGDPSDVPPRPGTITTGGGLSPSGAPDPNAVFVTTRDPVAIGGALSDRPFHLKVRCA
jgi:hypothetical protein